MPVDTPCFVAGDHSLVGSALARLLRERGRTVHGMAALQGAALGPADEPRAYDPSAIAAVFRRLGIEQVFLSSGKSHGIAENLRSPAHIMLENLFLECPIIHGAHLAGVKRLLYIASSCCYPRDCPQPMHPSSIFSGPPEPSNHAYSVAKLAALTLCQAYRKESGDAFTVCIPATPFGTHDDFDPERSHVIGALLHRLHAAHIAGDEAVSVWGSGTPRRDFIFADDLADACTWLMEHYDEPAPVNVSAYDDTTIRSIAETIREVVGYQGRLVFDTTKPDGMPVKILDSDFIRAAGWRPRHTLQEALRRTYQWYLDNFALSTTGKGHPT